MTSSTLEPLLFFLALMNLAATGMAFRTVVGPHRTKRIDQSETILMFGAISILALSIARDVPTMAQVGPLFLLVIAAATGLRYLTDRLSTPGALLLTGRLSMTCFGTAWGVGFVTGAGLPPEIEGCALLGLAFALVFGLLGLPEEVARGAVQTHALWQRPTRAEPPSPQMRARRVSIHLPCYAEPPDVVIRTMNRLAALDHDDFEVLVCDNNTRDEALWRPLEAHCDALNAMAGTGRFRFFHVAPLAGAKAGALNFCLDVMDPAAELVAVIDADYLAEADFLARLLPFFDDPAIGYVQTPHDYRDYADSVFLSACYWEYMPNNKVDMAGISEYGGAFTIGTMCVLRAAALRDIGGWAEWCLTEDSEVSVRLRAAGHEGIYVNETFGRGLIPETFDDYRKQRFRWTAGPVQQLRRHWRLFLPEPWAPRLPGWSKLLEVLRCAAPLRTVFGFAAALCGFLLTGTAMLGGRMQPLDVPDIVWVLLATGIPTALIGTWHRYRLSGATEIGEMIRGEIARSALTFTVWQAGLAGLSSRPIAWRRTPKFALTSANLPVFSATLPETLLGGGCAIFALCVLLASGRLGVEFALLAAGLLGMLSFRFLCAPLMAWLGTVHARTQLEGGESFGEVVGERETERVLLRA